MIGHLVSPRIYVRIFAALLVLTAITVASALVDLGGGRLNAANVVVAMTIAAIKGLLVVLYFMHVRYAGRLTWIFVGAGVFWLAILIVLTLTDYLSRGWFPTPGAWSS